MYQTRKGLVSGSLATLLLVVGACSPSADSGGAIPGNGVSNEQTSMSSTAGVTTNGSNVADATSQADLSAATASAGGSAALDTTTTTADATSMTTSTATGGSSTATNLATTAGGTSGQIVAAAGSTGAGGAANQVSTASTAGANAGDTSGGSSGLGGAGDSVGGSPTSANVGGAGGAPVNMGGAASGAGAGSVPPSGGLLNSATLVRIMPTGDSITQTGCWRKTLWNQLNDAGYNVDFVGSKNNEGDCGAGWDGDNEGYSGEKVTDDAAMAASWAVANPADVVLFHWGTNDIWTASIPIASILDAYTAMMSGFRQGNPNVILLVAQIIPVAPDGPTGTYPDRTVELNNALPAWATANSTAQSPIIVVDQWTDFPSDGTDDGVHPYNDSGVNHMASNWFDALSTLY